MNVTCHACIGGMNIRDDMKHLEAGAQVFVGTPGRVHDMLKRSALSTSFMSCIYRIFNILVVIGSENIKMFVLDEADEVLSRGFNEQIHDIFTMLREIVQIIVSSSTMPCDLLEMSAKLMDDPVEI
jgi:translation initiation factor 4A